MGARSLLRRRRRAARPLLDGATRRSRVSASLPRRQARAALRPRPRASPAPRPFRPLRGARRQRVRSLRRAGTRPTRSGHGLPRRCRRTHPRPSLRPRRRLQMALAPRPAPRLGSPESPPRHSRRALGTRAPLPPPVRRHCRGQSPRPVPRHLSAPKTAPQERVRGHDAAQATSLLTLLARPPARSLARSLAVGHDAPRTLFRAPSFVSLPRPPCRLLRGILPPRITCSPSRCPQAPLDISASPERPRLSKIETTQAGLSRETQSRD
mmetsp:Transcript_1508/g.4536  ORF Transcript_1508/g.4536 Transcript_1508/m.4536 type:complete len:267 (+) Transcript_1508:339-1139(+)